MPSRRQQASGGRRAKIPTPGNRSIARLVDFSGGLNNKFSPFLLSDNEVADICNMNFDEKGTLQKRKGYYRHYPSPIAQGPVRGLFNYRKEDGTSRLVLAADDKLFYDEPHFLKRWDSQPDWEEPNHSKNTHISTTAEPGSIQVTGTAADVVRTFTTQADFDGGTKAGVDTATQPDGVKLAVGLPAVLVTRTSQEDFDLGVKVGVNTTSKPGSVVLERQ